MHFLDDCLELISTGVNLRTVLHLTPGVSPEATSRVFRFARMRCMRARQSNVTALGL